MSVVDYSEYSHLLNLKTWFNEADIQSLVSTGFNGNIDNATILAKSSTANLQTLRNTLHGGVLGSFEYLFNQPDITVSDIEVVPESDIYVATTYPGVGKTFINDSDGGVSLALFQSWKDQGWLDEKNTGMFVNNFDHNGEQYIGMAITLLRMVVVVLVKSGKTNAVDPEPNPGPGPGPDPSGGSCQVAGIEFCDEEEDDDCEPQPVPCGNFEPAH